MISNKRVNCKGGLAAFSGNFLSIGQKSREAGLPGLSLKPWVIFPTKNLGGPWIPK